MTLEVNEVAAVIVNIFKEDVANGKEIDGDQVFARAAAALPGVSAEMLQSAFLLASEILFADAQRHDREARQYAREASVSMNKAISVCAELVANESDWKCRAVGMSWARDRLRMMAKEQDEGDDIVERGIKAVGHRVIDQLGRQPIVDPWQAMFYAAYGSEADKAASIEWQKCHQDEICPFIEAMKGKDELRH